MKAVQSRIMNLHRKKSMERENRSESLSRFSPSDHSLGAPNILCWWSWTVDSVDSWRSLVFYLYTGTVEFAPLKSQGADVRARYVQERTTADKSPPCSPKAIYSLASVVSSHSHVDCITDHFSHHSAHSLISNPSVILPWKTYGQKSLPQMLSWSSFRSSPPSRYPFWLKVSS